MPMPDVREWDGTAEGCMKKQPPGGGGCKGSGFGQSTIPVSSSIDSMTGIIHPGLSKGREPWLEYFPVAEFHHKSLLASEASRMEAKCVAG